MQNFTNVITLCALCGEKEEYYIHIDYNAGIGKVGKISIILSKNSIMKFKKFLKISGKISTDCFKKQENDKNFLFCLEVLEAKPRREKMFLLSKKNFAKF